ncbi:MAG: AMP-binding protein, partial [Ignavibacteriaceae bacterium]|nr:AMP-binding protein [Ignavibacteriaceae bacterium]
MKLEKYLSQLNYNSYEEFIEKFKINVPEGFNFAFDVVDEIANETPDKTAMVWCDDNGEERIFSFRDMKYYSDKAANYFKSIGIRKGDRVMLILKRRYEYWYCLLALHKLGAIAIPATHLLRTKDIVYRNNAADIKMIICVPETEVIKNVEEAQEKSPTLIYKALVTRSKEGWIDLTNEIEKASDKFVKTEDELSVRNDDTMLIYFTSGTTGMPKMVKHNYAYPLGHILTTKFWQNVSDNGLHLT